MKPVPSEYVETVEKSSHALATEAKTMMFIAEMLGDDKFELDTAEGFRVTIIKTPSEELITADG
jgi:hypothetical protein